MELKYLSYDDLWVLFVTANRHYLDYTKRHINVRDNFVQLSRVNVLLDELKIRRDKGERLSHSSSEPLLADLRL